MSSKMWIHNCKEAGETATLMGEPCNWCDVTFDEVESESLKERHDIINNPEELEWKS